MSKTVAVKKSFTFVKGLNTEGGPLTFPPHSWQEGTNIVPQLDGSLRKRTAINFESDYALSSAPNTTTEEETGAFHALEWNSVAGDGNRNFVVVQRASLVTFYDNSSGTLSSTEKAFSIDLQTYFAAGNPNVSGVAPISVASANGNLVITSGDTNPILVEYNEATDDITVSIIDLEIRDLYGLDDLLAVDERPATLSALHQYNLQNQGWPLVHINTYFASDALYPSNAQTWTTGKDASDVFSPALLDKQDFGTTPAAKGRYILNLFYRAYTSVSTVPGLSTVTENYRPVSCAFYAGRAWYAGIKSSTIGSWVLFSQVADTKEKYGFCYQEADPTSEFISDLIDTDGGVIPIQDAGNIIKLLPYANSLLVFADNGVWQISGGGSTGSFSASSYEVRKLTGVGCVGEHTVVEAEQAVYFWSNDGIWALASEANALTSDPVLSAKGFKNITTTSIASYYTAIPAPARNYAQGVYYLEGKTLYWVFNSDDDQDGVEHRYKKDTILAYDLRLGAFYTLDVSSLATNSPYITAVVVTKSRTATALSFDVVNNTPNNVVDGSANQVVASLSPTVLRNSELRFMTEVPQGGGASFKTTFARFEDGLIQAAKFMDWYDSNAVGITYPAYILTGYDFGNDQGGDKSIQALYLTAFLYRTETGVDSNGDAINDTSCLLQSRWDWTDLANTGKWGPEQQLYRHRRLFMPAVPSATYADGYPIVVSKNKVRGRGRAVQFSFTAEARKDLQLLGWAITYMGNSNV